MADDVIQQRQITWDDIASPTWHPEAGQGPIWISAYLIMMADRDQISPEPFVIDFQFAKAVAYYGQIPYVRLSEFKPESTEVPVFSMKVDEVTGKEGAYLLLVLPFDDSAPSQSEVHVTTRIQELVGVLTAVFGPNVAYYRLFDNVVLPKENQRMVFSQSFRSPTTLTPPDLCPEKAQLAQLAVQNLSCLPPSEANRISLSLRWYCEAQYTRGVDIFLKLWFALESLGMAERHNIRPIIQSLANTYQMNYDDAKRKFSIGRLFGFRSRIVHQGEIRPIHALLSDYVAAVYQDVLYEKMGLRHQGFAGRVQEDPQFNLESFIS